MNNKVIEKIQKAESFKKEDFVNEIKSKYPDKYDQMIVDSEPTTNNIYYIRYHARFANYKPTKVEFILNDNLSIQFKREYTGGSMVRGKVGIMEPSFISSIKDSDVVISENEIKSPSAPGIAEKVDGMIYLKNGFQKWLKKTHKVESFGESISKKSVFSGLDSKSKGSSEFHGMKLEYFDEMKLDFIGNKPADNQPVYFIPDLTQSKNCDSCKGKGESECSTCSGKGKIKCKGWVGPGTSGPVSNMHHACKNGVSTCSNCNGKSGGCSSCRYSGRASCPTCNGSGENTCSRKYNSSYGIGKLMDSAAGTDFCEGSGVITCKKCKGHGELGEVVYVEIEPQDIDTEYFFFENEKVPSVEKTPETIYKYLDDKNLELQQVYFNENGSISLDYDSFTEDVCEKIEKASGLEKKDYPKLFLESVYYDVIPAQTIEYLHVLTATRHKISAIDVANEKEMLFHSNPTAVSKFSISNLWKAYISKWPEAFMSKSYKVKRDKYNEIKMLIYIAKADGVIEESEKLVLANTISGLNEYTASQKAALFSLMTSNELQPLNTSDFVLSSGEVASKVKDRLREMAWEDGELETPEILLMEEYSKKIDENVGKYDKKTAHFFKTWQVSTTLLLAFVLGLFSVYYLLFIKPPKDAYLLHLENQKTEAHLLGFIEWTNADTLQNNDYEMFLLSTSFSSEADINIDEDFELDTYKEELDKKVNSLNHNSDLLIENEKISYKAYWKERMTQLKDILKSLLPILARRNEMAVLNKPNELEQKAQEPLDEYWYTVSDMDGFSNLRNSPDGDVIKKIYEGETFQIIENQGDWKKVRLNDDLKSEGFIHSTRIIKIEELEGDGYEEERDFYDSEE